MFNCARMTPVYLHQMYELKEKDSDTWELFMNGYFSINKTSVPFTAIGADHAIEYENRTMKVLGGIKGIANGINKLGKYFIIAPEINQIIQGFCEAFDIAKRDEHQELTGNKNQHVNKNQRITSHVQKLDETFKTQNVKFDESECAFDVVTKKILNPKLAEEFLAHETTGNELLENFIKVRFEGEKSIWDSITKSKLPTFGSNVKTVTVKIKYQLVQVKEEHKLISRFLIVCRTRHDIDLPSYLGDYEFSVVPRSLFTPDGQLYKSTDESVILNEMENLTNQAQDVLFHTSSVPNEKNNVIIFESMAIVNSISNENSKYIKTCEDFENVFTNQIIDESQRFSEIRIIFDFYLHTSLKSKTRNDRTNGTQILYKVDDSTIIKLLKISKFRSHIMTKQDWTVYLSQRLEIALTKTNISYVIS